MDLNYHHLYYFHVVAKQGSIARASEELKLTQPTISEQIHLLEKMIGRTLFDRVGRSLVLTETGKAVLAYTEKIFALGKDLTRTLAKKPERPTLRVAVDSCLSSQLLAQILGPALRLATIEAIALTENSASSSNVDLVLSPHKAIKGLESRRLIEFGTVILISKRTRKSPRDLTLIVPAPLASQLLSWLRANRIKATTMATVHSFDLAQTLADEQGVAFATANFQIPRSHRVLHRIQDVRSGVFAHTRKGTRNPAVRALFHR